uniref:SIS domain-containing protein n=1 Tax=Tessaracoccus timonensis TaxID=2161816 RepID=UPI000D553645|nr:SIS domain-containing protein [Tessaracoccus timonensis]
MDRVSSSKSETVNMLEYARAQVQKEGNAVLAVADQLDESFIEVVQRVRRVVGKLFVTGSGTSSAVARRMAHLLSVSGTPALFIHSMDALHGTMGSVEPNDLVIAISKGGESDEVNQFVQLVHDKGTEIIALTENPSGTLASLADTVAILHSPDDADPGNLLAMGSTLMAAAWGDALARTLMYVGDWDLRDSVKMHPAGAVGKAARSGAASDE